jgi:hypothetical protein
MKASKSRNVVKPKLNIGDFIEFYYFGQIKRGRITDVGKYGYWIDNTSGVVGNGSIRCPFGKELELNTDKI